MYFVKLFNRADGGQEDKGYDLKIFHPYWPGPLAMVTGSVVDLLSLNPIDGALILTNGAGAAISVRGRYVLFHIMGSGWKITAFKQGYIPYFNSLSLTVESLFHLKPIVMIPIEKPECSTSTDCDDGVYCNGEENCDVSGNCQDAPPPCPEELCDEENSFCKECSLATDCEDGLYCNGVETCENGICGNGEDPCEESETCDEESDICVEGPSIALLPNPCFQSRWMPLPLFLRIIGTDTHFDATSRITFDPTGTVMAFPILRNEEHIFMVGLIMPTWLAPPIQAINVIVTTGSEVVSETMDLSPLPFMLRERNEIQTVITP
jgi:hypothetical protein